MEMFCSNLWKFFQETQKFPGKSSLVYRLVVYSTEEDEDESNAAVAAHQLVTSSSLHHSGLADLSTPDYWFPPL
ncbi:hypothetical protein J6590_006953 [Homalodisca vitripennis]|nr:hypothetical protein J6590_006953 [Homalodisca vitripennis]